MKKTLILTITLLLTTSTAMSQQSAVRLGTGSEVRNTIIFQNPDGTPVSPGVPARHSASDAALTGIEGNIILPSTPFRATGDFRIYRHSVVQDGGYDGHLGATDTLDLYNNPRISCRGVDIGAFEYQVQPAEITQQPINPGRVCEGSTVLLQTAATGDGVTFQWQRSTDNQATFHNLINQTGAHLSFPSVAITDTGYYRVIAIGSCCSDTSDIVRLDVDLRPTLTVMDSPIIIYSGEDVTLYVVESTGAVFWTERIGVAPNIDTIAIFDLNITNITESRQFFATATNGVCADVVERIVTIIVSGQACVVRTQPDQTVCAGDAFLLVLDPTGTTVETQWFNVETGVQIQNGVWVAPTTTTRFELVGLRDGAVCARDTLLITVPQIPLDVRADGTYCIGTTVWLTSEPQADIWFDPDGYIAGHQNSSVAPPPNATTIYTAQITDPVSGCVVRRDVAITLNPPDLTILFANQIEHGRYTLTVCEGDTIRLITNQPEDRVMWHWEDGTQIQIPDRTITATTTQTFQGKAYDGVCGTVFIYLTLNVEQKPDFYIQPQDPICAGRDQVWPLVSVNGIVREADIWTDMQGTRIFMPQTPLETASYIAEVTVGVCTVRDVVTVIVENPANFNAGPQNETITQGGSVLLWADPEPVGWFIAETEEALSGLLVSPLQTTAYVARWETDICGTIFDTVVIYVDVPLVLTLEITSESGCYMGQGWASVNVLTGVEPFTFIWNTGATTQRIDNLMPGIYTVTVIDGLGVTGTAQTTISLVSPINVIYLTDVATSQRCDNGNIRITVTGGTMPYQFEWRRVWEDGVFSVGQDLFNVSAGTYTLLVTDAAGCQRFLPQVILRCEFQRVMPSILLTPNDDGMNDFVYIQDIEHFPINTVTIISSYGEEIIRIQNFNNRDIRWDGRNRRGRLVPDGTYFFVVEAEGVRPMAGWIIVRGVGSR